MELTTSSQDYLNKQAVGYMVNTILSESSRISIKSIQEAFRSTFRDDVWVTPADALHITLLDWLAPLVEYGEDKDSIFGKIFSEYDTVLSGILREVEPVDVVFGKMIVSPSAVAIVADEKATQVLNGIRQKFLERINLQPDTKQPPNIVHSTIIRFMGEIALDDVKELAESLDILFTERIDSFQLVRETRLPMLEFSVVKTYSL